MVETPKQEPERSKPGIGPRPFVVGLAFGGLVACVGTALLVIGYRSAREDSNKTRCRENLNQLGLALHNYHEAFHCFPPAYVNDEDGRPAHSWRVLILPYLGELRLYRAYHWDEPWDGPNNSKLAKRMPAVFACPSDRKRGSGMSSYVAVVGPATAWPESHSVTIRDIRDGTASTIQLVECANSGIGWLEPRDIDVVQARLGVNVGSHPNVSSVHASGAHVVFADGTARFLTNTVDLEMFRAVLTINGGKPLADVDWTEDGSSGIGDFPPERPASSFVRTDVLPHAKDKLTAGRNYVYCGTFQLAWNDLRERLGDSIVKLDDSPDFADKLNAGTFRRADLNEDSYLAMGGAVGAGIADHIRLELGRRFPNATLRPPTPMSDDEILLYAYLQKTLPFQMAFDRLLDPIVFRATAGKLRVAAFGIKEFRDRAGPDAELSAQVTVLDYESDDDFIVRLATKKADEIILAKVAPAATLDETLASVMDRVRQRGTAYKRPNLENGESLVIPKLAISVDRDYPELVGRHIQNPKWSGWPIRMAFQRIRFLLNERGARLQSDAAIIVTSNGHSQPPRPPAPRHLVFDRPFLICLREGSEKEPYLVMWVENGEVMEPR